jgi:asparagine synthase (glutamine-hydrolysing)
MNAAMVYRGPDDEGIFLEPSGGLGLGARRLSVIDVEGGHQPLANEDRTVWGVLNGEIYNFASLRESLIKGGHRFASRSDTEVLVHLYEEDGLEFVDRLEGMYAFAIWDSVARRLLLSRDRYGEKPLFYAECEGSLVFASELTALLDSGVVGGGLEPATVDAYFVYGYVPDDTAFVRGVRQLPPSTTLVWDDATKRITTRRYWMPPVHTGGNGTPLPDLASRLGEAIERAVEHRLVADVPLGVFLSGGVDSSLVAALAAGKVTGSLKTFSVGYDTGEVNETGHAARVAGMIGAHHHELILSSDEIRASVPGMLAGLDQPVADPAFVALRALAGHARRLVTVAVGGEGADELFGGYPRYRWLARGSRLPGWFPRAACEKAVGQVARLGSARADRLAHVLSPAPLFERHLEWVTSGRTTLRQVLYGPRLKESAVSDIAAVPDGLDRIAACGDIAGALMRLDQVRWLPGDVLAKADRATMQVSLELRTPFLDSHVAAVAASVPSSVHLRDGGKSLLRKLLGHVLPQHRLGTVKTAFRTPTGEWLHGPLAPALAEHVRTSRLYEGGWFDRGRVAALAQEHLDGRRDASTVLWPLFVLGTWLDAHPEMDGE